LRKGDDNLMPYISHEEKIDIDAGMQPATPGQLTYAITRLAVRFAREQGKIRFATLCLVIGAIVCAAFEFYRRVVAPYEDAKMAQNGDVYLE
jgi:hypothetical protein